MVVDLEAVAEDARAGKKGPPSPEAGAILAGLGDERGAAARSSDGERAIGEAGGGGT